MEATRYNEALAQLKALTTESPASIDGWLLKGALELQENLFADADTSYQQFLQLADKTNIATNHPGRIQAYLGLAQLAENRKDYDMAQSWLGKIEDDKERLAAQLRRACDVVERAHQAGDVAHGARRRAALGDGAGRFAFEVDDHEVVARHQNLSEMIVAVDADAAGVDGGAGRAGAAAVTRANAGWREAANRFAPDLEHVQQAHVLAAPAGDGAGGGAPHERHAVRDGAPQQGTRSRQPDARSPVARPSSCAPYQCALAAAPEIPSIETLTAARRHCRS